MKILITGDSHTGALQRGKELLLTQGLLSPDLDLNIRPMGGGHILPSPFYEDRGDHAAISDPTYKKQFARFPLEKFSNSEILYGFTSLLHTTRIWRHYDWKKFVPITLVKNEAAISRSLINRVIYDDSKYLLGMIDVMLRTQQKVFAVEAPKPFKRHIERTNIRSEVALFVDKHYRNFIRNELSKRNIPIVSIDTECYDADGFMLDEYQSDTPNDMHHGNAKFGAIMLNKTLKLLKNEFDIKEN